MSHPEELLVFVIKGKYVSFYHGTLAKSLWVFLENRGEE